MGKRKKKEEKGRKRMKKMKEMKKKIGRGMEKGIPRGYARRDGKDERRLIIDVIQVMRCTEESRP